ncbi:MAG TPA: hypothetical protein VIS56_01255 [Candidatus Saccharimonadales bacterium]
MVAEASETIKTLRQQVGTLPFSIHLTTPHNVTFDIQDFPEWSLYDFAFDEYMNIGSADCQIVCNETPRRKGFINKSLAREILCGMYKQKVIVMLHVPVFDGDIDEYSKALISAKLDKFYICDLLDLDANDVRNFMYDVSRKTINYGLTNYDLRQIKGRIRNHLLALQKA